MHHRAGDADDAGLCGRAGLPAAYVLRDDAGLPVRDSRAADNDAHVPVFCVPDTFPSSLRSVFPGVPGKFPFPPM